MSMMKLLLVYAKTFFSRTRLSITLLSCSFLFPICFMAYYFLNPWDDSYLSSTTKTVANPPSPRMPFFTKSSRPYFLSESAMVLLKASSICDSKLIDSFGSIILLLFYRVLESGSQQKSLPI